MQIGSVKLSRQVSSANRLHITIARVRLCWDALHERKLAGYHVLKRRIPQSAHCHLCRHFAEESPSSADSDSSSDDLVGIGVMRSPAHGSQAQQAQVQRQRQGAAAGGRSGQGASPRGPRPGNRVDTSPVTWQGQVRDLGRE